MIFLYFSITPSLSSDDKSAVEMKIVSYLLNVLPPYGSIARIPDPGKESLFLILIKVALPL